MKSQGQISDEIRNKVANQGIFMVEKEVEYDGETIIIYAIMPSKLAEHADDILAQIVPDNEDHDEEPEVVENEEVPDAPKADKPKVKKTAKPKAPAKKLTKKTKK